MAHVLLAHHSPMGWKLRQLGQLGTPTNTVFSVFSPSMLAQMLSCWEKFTTIITRNFLSVGSVLANGLKMKEKLGTLIKLEINVYYPIDNNALD